MAIQQLNEEQIRTWTRAQKDEWWFKNIYRGDMPQLTWSSGLSGFFVGGIPVDPATVVRVNGVTYTFTVPAGLAPDQFHDVSVVNADGQGSVTSGAFYIVPPPVITSLSIATAGPAGGRNIRVAGDQPFRAIDSRWMLSTSRALALTSLCRAVGRCPR